MAVVQPGSHLPSVQSGPFAVASGPSCRRDEDWSEIEALLATPVAAAGARLPVARDAKVAVASFAMVVAVGAGLALVPSDPLGKDCSAGGGSACAEMQPSAATRTMAKTVAAASDKRVSSGMVVGGEGPLTEGRSAVTFASEPLAPLDPAAIVTDRRKTSGGGRLRSHKHVGHLDPAAD